MQVTSIFKRSVVVTLVFAMLAMMMILKPVSAQDLPTNKTDFSGEELFRGIVFLQGDVVNYIPELKKLKDSVPNAEPQGEELELMDSIILAINELDAAYFNNLKNAIDSNNPNQIKSELDYGGELLVKTNLLPLSDLAYKDNGVGVGLCAVATVFSVAIGAVSIALVAGVDTYVVVTREFWWGSSVASINGNSISGERLISSLAVNL
ncbi:hypothetical protein [Paenibacillus sp. IHBB 10380]|uniref:hypothetical protein n=1 Tax=Paenibacillus sp. IHBB 10380 TaxID=1566358 RepID=UPI0005CFB24A|nr:hypothetical protein [Paenibacillus sp. IHBB 10380]AJS59933.1 hypothetical protein UB51_17285 [Paenibacillus sp. IHBB 10380]